MKTLIIAAVAAVTVAAPAYAQDAAPFTGARAEVLAGYDSVKTNSNGLGSPDGFLYGFGIGYDVQAGGVVAGIEGEVADSTTKIDFLGGSLKSSRDLYVGARAGFLIAPNALAYVKAGYTNARFTTTGFGGENGDGVRFGGGLEVKLSSNLYAKGEYRYSNYEGDIERHQVVGGVGLRF